MEIRSILVLAVLCFLVGAGAALGVVVLVPGGYADCVAELGRIKSNSTDVLGNLERIGKDGAGIRDAINRADGLLQGSGTFSERLRALGRAVRDLGQRYDQHIAGLEAEIARLRTVLEDRDLD